jgi:P27 family predicted phage terminase small subunit
MESSSEPPMSISIMEGGAGAPPEPDWASIYSDEFDIAAAHEHWGTVVRELQSANTLAVANGDAIRRLVEFHVQYERAAKHVAEHGAILPPKNKRTKVGQWNPFWSVMRQADKAILALEAELGLSPVRRGKAEKVQRGKTKIRAADAYLRSVPG